MNEHATICMKGADLVEDELRKPMCDKITVYAVHSTPNTSGRIVITAPASEDAQEGFTVLHPGISSDWRAVPYSAIFARLMEATRSVPILAYAPPIEKQ